MKTNLYSLLFLLLPLTSFSQDWQTNIDTAKALSARTGRDIVMVFQGSDWCVPCMKLDHSIWQSETFKAYAEDHFIMLKVDFPRRKKNKLSAEQKQHNERLAEKYNLKGYFPFVVVLDAKGQVIKVMGYEDISPEEYITKLESR